MGTGFRTGQVVNPVERGHIAFRTDDIAAFKKRLDEKGIRYSDYGGWAMSGWHQIFFYDPDGNVIEVHQAPAGTACGAAVQELQLFQQPRQGFLAGGARLLARLEKDVRALDRLALSGAIDLPAPRLGQRRPALDDHRIVGRVEILQHDGHMRPAAANCQRRLRPAEAFFRPSVNPSPRARSRPPAAAWRLVVHGEQVPFGGRGEAALRRQAELVERRRTSRPASMRRFSSSLALELAGFLVVTRPSTTILPLGTKRKRLRSRPSARRRIPGRSRRHRAR